MELIPYFPKVQLYRIIQFDHSELSKNELALPIIGFFA